MARQAHVTQKHRGNSAAHIGDQAAQATESALQLVKDYARERPEVVALWAFGIGFVLGWKLKPW